MPMPRKTLDELLDTGAALVRRWHQIDGPKTEVLRELAHVVVDIRSRYCYESAPDWAGRSWKYRRAIAAMYLAAGIPPDAVASVQGALRYHVGNALRERVDAEELESAGLKVASPKERVASARSEAAALVSVLRADKAAEEAEARGRSYPIGLLLRASLVAVERAARGARDPEVLDAGSAEDLESALLAAMDLREHLDGIVEALRAAYVRRSGVETVSEG